MKKQFLILCALVLSLPLAQAEVTLPSLFQDHMVLQRDQDNYLWGWGGCRGRPLRYLSTAIPVQRRLVAKGSWYVILPPTGLGDAKTITVQGTNTITVSDILMGDVWVCSGQSNMAMTVKGSNDAKTEIANANYPKIRYFNVPKLVALTPQSDIKGSWVLTTPEVAGNYSAAGYFFGRELHKELDVPIGLIVSAWGGTAIESWMSQDAANLSETYTRLNDAWQPDVDKYGETMISFYMHLGLDRVDRPDSIRNMGNTPNVPSFTYNAMIAPLWRFGIKGAHLVSG